MALNAAILGAGFIGQNFIRLGLQSGDNLWVLDHKECPVEFDGSLTWIKGDLSDGNAVRCALQNVDVVYHFISSTVPGDVTDESSELIQNVVQTLRLLKLCVQEKVRRVVFISSASVYGVQEYLPIPETALTNPISSHGIHKLTIEKYLQLYQYQHGLDCKIMRLSNPYGPGQSVTGRQGFIAIAIGKILAGDAVMVRGDGSTLRDYIYIDDVSEALHLMGTTQARESVFNVGSGQGYTLNQIISIIGELTGKQVQIEYADSRFVDIPASVLDISREQAILGKSAVISLRDGLAKTLQFHGIRLAA